MQAWRRKNCINYAGMSVLDGKRRKFVANLRLELQFFEIQACILIVIYV